MAISGLVTKKTGSQWGGKKEHGGERPLADVRGSLNVGQKNEIKKKKVSAEANSGVGESSIRQNIAMRQAGGRRGRTKEPSNARRGERKSEVQKGKE